MSDERRGLYLCCMRAAERRHNHGAEKGDAFNCPKCGQKIVNTGGGWKCADDSPEPRFEQETT